MCMSFREGVTRTAEAPVILDPTPLLPSADCRRVMGFDAGGTVFIQYSEPPIEI
jgi:hypothetical protein